MTTKKAFPKQVFVQYEEDGDDAYLLAYNDVDGIADGEYIAIYQLVEVRKMKVTRELL